MTREEAISLIKSAQLMLVNPTTNEPVSDLYEAFDMAIKELENKPRFLVHSDGEIEQVIEFCDDAVSRQAVLKINENHHGEMPNHINFEIWNEIKALPPVIPKRKQGEWIDCQDEGHVECPICGSATNCDDNKEDLHYCFSCGADMRGD